VSLPKCLSEIPRIYGGAGKAVPRKVISQKNPTRHCSGLIFEGCTTRALAECLVQTKTKLSQPSKISPPPMNAIDIALRGIAFTSESLIGLKQKFVIGLEGSSKSLQKPMVKIGPGREPRYFGRDTGTRIQIQRGICGTAHFHGMNKNDQDKIRSLISETSSFSDIIFVILLKPLVSPNIIHPTTLFS
jgi:hypothetical protein